MSPTFSLPMLICITDFCASTLLSDLAYLFDSSVCESFELASTNASGFGFSDACNLEGLILPESLKTSEGLSKLSLGFGLRYGSSLMILPSFTPCCYLSSCLFKEKFCSKLLTTFSIGPIFGSVGIILLLNFFIFSF